jgi:hypothetical protein
MFSDQGIPHSALKVVLELGSTESAITGDSDGVGLSVGSSIATRNAEAACFSESRKTDGAKSTRKSYLARHRKELPKTVENFWDLCKRFDFKKETLLVGGAL